MDNKNIVIDINSINSTKQLMNNECDKLLSLIAQYKTMFEDTKAIYDTDSATIYRRIASGYLDIVENYIKDNFKVYIGQLDTIEKTYQDEIGMVSQSINGGRG